MDNARRVWSAPAERSGDGAFVRALPVSTGAKAGPRFACPALQKPGHLEICSSFQARPGKSPPSNVWSWPVSQKAKGA